MDVNAMKLTGLTTTAFLCAFLSTTSVWAAYSNPVIDISVVNETYGTVKLVHYSSTDSTLTRPKTAYNVGPGTTELANIYIPWNFTFRDSRFVGLKSRGPSETTLAFETADGVRCTVHTKLNVTAPEGFKPVSFIEPKLTARRTSTVRQTGSTSSPNKCQLNESLTNEAPFSYGLELVIGTNDPYRKEF